MRRDPFVLQAGQLVDRYQLLLPVAAGGASQIWAARLHGTRGFEKLVGLKTLAAAPDSGSPELERLLWREGRLASQIEHPNVVNYFDLIEHRGVLCVAMEWIDGESLSSLLRAASRTGGIPLGVAVQIIVQACKGLHAAHELCGADGRPLGLAHCDVSPQNLMIDVSGTVKLVDFGIAKVRRRGADSDDDDDRVRGKPSFMAPEQAMGQHVDLRADIFSLGIVSYLLTTGRHPFRSANAANAANAADTLRAICLDVPVVPPCEIVENYPRSLQRVVMRALASQPAQRFQSAAEMLSELVAAFPGYASEAELSSLLQTLCGSSLMRRRALVNEALQRHSVPNFADVPGSYATRGEPTSDTLSPAHLAAYPVHPSAPGARWRSTGVALAAGALAFSAAFGWTLARTAASFYSSSAPAARAELAAKPHAVAADAPPTVEAQTSAAPAQSAAQPVPSTDAAPAPVAPSAILPALAASANAPASDKASLAPVKKRKPIPVRQRYGI